MGKKEWEIAKNFFEIQKQIEEIMFGKEFAKEHYELNKKIVLEETSPKCPVCGSKMVENGELKPFQPKENASNIIIYLCERCGHRVVEKAKR